MERLPVTRLRARRFSSQDQGAQILSRTRRWPQCHQINSRSKTGHRNELVSREKDTYLKHKQGNKINIPILISIRQKEEN